MSETRIADILDGFHDLLAAEATLAQQVTAGDLVIFDGPAIGARPAPSVLCIGGFFGDEDDESETSVEWDWASMGRSGQYADVDEWVRVPCVISSLNGNSSDMRTARRTAITIYAKAAAAIRDTTLSIPQVMWCISGVASIAQLQSPMGAECLIFFTAAARTRI